jgi:hypothetical protein
VKYLSKERTGRSGSVPVVFLMDVDDKVRILAATKKV